MGSLNETRITRRIRKQTRKEPRSAEHFERMYLLLKERNQKLRGGAVAFSRGVAITQAKEIMAFVGMNRGRGVHVFCPLKLGLHVGEFLKGFFKYAAPEARVTLLITPKADVIGYDTEAEKSKRGFALIGGEDWTSKLISNVRNHLQKSARSTDTKLVFFDDHAFGRTRWLIEQAIEQIPALSNKTLEFPPSSSLGKFIAGTYTGKGNAVLSWLEHGHKTQTGEFWADAHNFMQSKSEERQFKLQNPELNRKASEKLKFDRRFAYNLGITVAREYLKTTSQ